MILILDLGSQYTQLIAKRVRNNNVYAEIYPYSIKLEKIKKLQPEGIILSGGPSDVFEDDAPVIDKKIFDLGIPILGICYGMHLIVSLLGGKVVETKDREYGKISMFRKDSWYDLSILNGLPSMNIVWASHGNDIEHLPPNFLVLAKSGKNGSISVIENKEKKIFGVNFHPEVTHTYDGSKIFENFLFKICNCSKTWMMSSFIDKAIIDIKNRVGNGRVICAFSGGIDSSVTAVLVHKAIGDRLLCVFVDNGLLRNDEVTQVMDIFQKKLELPLIMVDAKERFLSKLKGIVDPEVKRKIIGKEFIEVFQSEASKHDPEFDFLAQGTLYPDGHLHELRDTIM